MFKEVNSCIMILTKLRGRVPQPSADFSSKIFCIITASQSLYEIIFVLFSGPSGA